MARIRTIKPEFWHDEKLAPCDPLTRLVFLGLISAADDFGRVLDNERVLNAFMFPETSDSVREPLANLSRMGRVQRGKTASGQRVIQIVNWERHQKVDKPQPKMAFPEIVEAIEDTDVRESFANHSRTDREPLAPHTTDPDLHTTDQRPIAPRKRAAHGEGPKFPHFPMPLCLDMHALWVSKFGAVTVPVFRKEFGPLFTIAEADRPTTAPTNAELLAALKSYVDLAPMGDGATFATVRRAASVLSAIANARREYAEEPERRLDTVMRIIHGRPRLAA
jgi:hypothetical protein